MEYQKFIRTLCADILNGKRDYSNITSNRDFFYIQYVFLKMGKMDRVIEMGKIAHDKNIKNGIDINFDRTSAYKNK